MTYFLKGFFITAIPAAVVAALASNYHPWAVGYLVGTCIACLIVVLAE
jgi:hypothetical protein